MKCRYVRERLQPLVDGALTEAEAAAIEHHLRGCAACRAEFESLRLIDGALSAEPPVEPPPDMTAAIVQRAHARFGRPATMLVPRWLEALTFGALGLVVIGAAVVARIAAVNAVIPHAFGFNLGELLFIVLCIGVALFGSLYYGSQASAA